jgi:hypothetical protein
VSLPEPIFFEKIKKLWLSSLFVFHAGAMALIVLSLPS